MPVLARAFTFFPLFPSLWLQGNVDASAHRSKHLAICRHKRRCLSILLHALETVHQCQKSHSLLGRIWDGKGFNYVTVQRHCSRHLVPSSSNISLITLPFSFEVAAEELEYGQMCLFLCCFMSAFGWCFVLFYAAVGDRGVFCLFLGGDL